MVAHLLLAHSLLERKYTLCVFGTGIAVTSATDCPDFRVTVTVFVYFLLFVTSWDTGIVLEFSNRPHERATNTATHLTHPRHGPGLSRLIEAACQTRTSQCGDAESHAASTCTALRILPLAHTQQPSLLAVLPKQLGAFKCPHRTQHVGRYCEATPTARGCEAELDAQQGQPPRRRL
jgi:hypothetical protein